MKKILMILVMISFAWSANAQEMQERERITTHHFAPPAQSVEDMSEGQNPPPTCAQRLTATWKQTLARAFTITGLVTTILLTTNKINNNINDIKSDIKSYIEKHPGNIACQYVCHPCQQIYHVDFPISRDGAAYKCGKVCPGYSLIQEFSVACRKDGVPIFVPQ